MKDERKKLGAWGVLKIFAGVVVLACVTIVVLWVFNVPVVKTSKYLDVYSGREMVTRSYLWLPGTSKIIDTSFAQSAVRQGLVTRAPEWHIFHVETLPNNASRWNFNAGAVVSQLRSLEMAFEINQTSQVDRDAMVRAVYPHLATFNNFTVDYGDEMKPLGVNGKPATPP
jgi:hypothetical protein